MGDSEEAAYIAVERAYGDGRFTAALEQAMALQTQLQPGRSDQLDLRLQLLIGHIHYYGLQQPGPAAIAYDQVLQNSNNAAYRALASQGLTLCGPQEDSNAPVVAESARPATPWLDQLRDPDQALQDIRSAWKGADLSQQRSSSDQPAASPWSLEKPTAAFTTGDTARFASMADEPTAHEATVAEPVADVQTTDDPAPTEESRADREPEAPEAGLARVDDSAVFSSDEWTDYARGLLLVELSSGTGAMR